MPFGPDPLKNGKGASLIPQSADSLLVEFPDGNVTISTFALFNRTSYMHILQILPLKDDLMRTFYTFEAIRGVWIETGSCSGGPQPIDPMTANRRISLNIIATYMRRRSFASEGRCRRHIAAENRRSRFEGSRRPCEAARKGPRRSLYAMVIGLFCWWWMLAGAVV